MLRYELLYTPHMAPIDLRKARRSQPSPLHSWRRDQASLDLWKTSGHFDFYADGMFNAMEVEMSRDEPR